MLYYKTGSGIRFNESEVSEKIEQNKSKSNSVITNGDCYEIFNDDYSKIYT